MTIEILKNKTVLLVTISLALLGCRVDSPSKPWVIDTTSEWRGACKTSENIGFEKGFAVPIKNAGTFRSVIRSFERPLSPLAITFQQSSKWTNWEPIENVGPANLEDAPVALVMGPGDYWMFGRYGESGEKEFTPKAATLDGFDVPLETTPFSHQFNAPGGLKESLGGYHGWQSRDMINWVHHGPVTEEFSRWVTTAEQVGGKTHIYYDYPNDQDPHLYIDDNLEDGMPGRDMGLVFKDPSHGSDCAFIRDLEGRFHVIYEDWTPINAREHSWDSPLAGHAVSEDGISNFRILPPAVDLRTTPTGEKATYLHPHWTQHPDWTSDTAEYSVHEPEQDAFGDWAAISIGGRYYLFCDYHRANEKIKLAWFTSEDIGQPFTFCGEIGLGHPDPDIAFANGRFYLITQMETDYVSDGPWVEEVRVRVGVDTDKKGGIDKWTSWQEVGESYDYIQGFSKQIKRIPAFVDLSELPAGYGIAFEFQIMDTTTNESMPVLDSIAISFR